MTSPARPPLLRTAAIGAVAGVIATVAKSRAEPLLQGLFEARLPPPAGAKNLVGADPADAPENMPPAAMLRKAGSAMGVEPPAHVLIAGQQAIHVTFGTVVGLAYAVAVRALPLATLGGGVPAGLALYAATHASTIPLLGIQPPPTEMPPAAVLWESTSHAVYGLTLELVRRLLTEALA